MHVLNQLSKHGSRLQELAYMEYYSVELKNNALGVADICQIVIGNPNILAVDELGLFCDSVSRFCLHLEGSTKSEFPYAVGQCLLHAIDDWYSSEKVTILHTRNNEEEFYFDDISWSFILRIARIVNPEFQLTQHLVLVGTPRVFKNASLFYAALYHEIAHWVDELLGISSPLHCEESIRSTNTFVSSDHYKEHFADYFAACYIGETIVEILTVLDPNAEETETHPATENRVEFIRKFMRGEEFEELNVFQRVLKDNNLP